MNFGNNDWLRSTLGACVELEPLTPQSAPLGHPASVKAHPPLRLAQDARC
jgi:hypothetical protein